MEDIGEENNVAAKYPDIIVEMETILKEARTPSEIFTFGDGSYLNDK
jgi:hypothetical protein